MTDPTAPPDLEEIGTLLDKTECACSNERLCGFHYEYRNEVLAAAIQLADEVTELREALERLRQWINDLQAGMYINCVYCGHRYGPDTDVSASMADVLKEHVEQCPEHPMSKLREALEKIANEEDQVYRGEFPYHKGRAAGLRECGALARAALPPESESDREGE